MIRSSPSASTVLVACWERRADYFAGIPEPSYTLDDIVVVVDEDWCVDPDALVPTEGGG